MGNSRRGWTRSANEGWWFQEKDQDFYMKFTEEAEDRMFGDSRDRSDLQLSDAVQLVTHVSCTVRTTSNNGKKFMSILDSAHDPVPSLSDLKWRNGEMGVAPILDAIKSRKLSKLTTLHIGGPGFEVEGLAIAIKSGCLPFLEVLSVAGRPGHLALAEVMQAGQTPLLKEINLRFSEMTASECQAYATAFNSGKLPSLTDIDFAFNENIGDKGVEAVGLALQSGQLKELQAINFSRCGFGDEGLTAIANSFRAAPGSCVPKLQQLVFWANHFTDVGLRPLADALRNGHLNSLEQLDLTDSSGKMSGRGAGDLLSALASNILLNVDLRLEWYKFPDLERRKVQFVERNKKYKAILAGLATSPVLPATIGKIYLCGDPEVGKTTLRQSLQRSFCKSVLTWERRPHAEKRTRGIDVSQIVSNVSKPGEIPTTLLVWDMAGQRDYHIIHNAFFPDLGTVQGKATTFVVVCSSESRDLEESQRQLDYWLRFIASSCGKGTQNLRHVSFVLNRMKGDQKASKRTSYWKQVLEAVKEKFKDFLNIRTDPFIVDVRRRRSVQELKGCLLEHSRNLLQDEKVPQICKDLQQNLTVWSRARRQFPVLEWTAFVTEVREMVDDQLWRDEDLQAATRYLNEAGNLIYIEKEAFGQRKLVVLDPNWFCRDIIGSMFLHQDMVDHGEPLFRLEVDKKTGSISISKFKLFFKSLSNEWTPSSIEDLISILLWLGLCYQGRDENIFIPSLIAESGTPRQTWGHSKALRNNSESGEDQWVMGFSVEHHQSHLTLAPIALWHRFQVELAQTMRFNGRPDNEFICGRNFMSFIVDYMVVFIEVIANESNPTFDNINIYVKPLLGDDDDDLDEKDRKQCQVDQASDLVEILLKLWNEVCPGVEYLHKVVWPWPASFCGVHALPERNVDVEDVKKWVQEHNLGRKMQWKVGHRTITEDQLLSSKDKDSVSKSVQRSLHVLRQVLEEAVDLGIYPHDVLSGEVSSRESSVTSNKMEVLSPPRSASGRWVMKKLENLGEQLNEVQKEVHQVHKKVDNLREILKNQKRLRQKLQDLGDMFLQDKERSCPRYIYLGEKDSGRWVTLKQALSPSMSFQLHFACEARYDDYGQHAVKDQQGLQVSQLKKWAETIAPWLNVSLTAMYISAKVAANVVVPGLGLLLPNFVDWQEAASLSEGLALATGFPKDVNNHLIEEMGLDAHDPKWDPQELYGKSRAAMSKLVKLTPESFEKLGLRRVCLKYGDDSLHGIVWICNACFEKYRQSNISVIEL